MVEGILLYKTRRCLQGSSFEAHVAASKVAAALFEEWGSRQGRKTWATDRNDHWFCRLDAAWMPGEFEWGDPVEAGDMKIRCGTRKDVDEHPA